MGVKSLDLSWIIVSDLEKAKDFFTNKLGMKLQVCNENYGWLELSGQEGGSTLGIATADDKNFVKAGSNAVVTLTVENILPAKEEMLKKGVEFLGEMMEVPGHVKLQMFKDDDGNLFQLVEVIKN